MSYTPNAPILSDEYVTILICVSSGVGLLFALYQYLKIRRINIYSRLDDSYSMIEENRGYDNFTIFEEYASKVNNTKQQLLKLLTNLKNKGKNIIKIGQSKRLQKRYFRFQMEQLLVQKKMQL